MASSYVDSQARKTLIFKTERTNNDFQDKTDIYWLTKQDRKVMNVKICKLNNDFKTERTNIEIQDHTDKS